MRARHRAIDAAAKLGGTAQTKWWQVPKPKGMHWQTYSRLALEARRTEEDANRQFVAMSVAYFAGSLCPLVLEEGWDKVD